MSEDLDQAPEPEAKQAAEPPAPVKSQVVDKYFKVHVETSSKDQLLLMVVDGVLRFIGKARDALLEGDIEGKNTSLLKAQALVLELHNALSPDIGEKTFRDLRGLYFFVYKRLVEANVEVDLASAVSPLDEAIEIFSHVRETWRLAVDDYRQSLKPAAGAVAGDDESQVDRPRLCVSG